MSAKDALGKCSNCGHNKPIKVDKRITAYRLYCPRCGRISSLITVPIDLEQGKKKK
jgi:predicted RNA-binding Zn-ribbon protein involved in translation (DUF1610 family)